MKKIIFIATFEEAEALISVLEAEECSKDRYLFEGGEIIICGVGPEEAALSAKKAKRGLWLNVGIAGSPVYEREAIVRIGATALLEAPLECIVLDESFPATLYTSSFPVYSVPKVGESHYLVDMEGFSIARVAYERKIPCSITKIVSDFCDQDSHKAIQTRLPYYSSKICDLVFNSRHAT